ncbi:MAG TPA: methylenetetrahydrofolate reductase [Candidatus Stackebrandtia faecavium]|nr:methylenetetrahydrofolate reductase [Candidatus Stackebrandtia faecavium]
MSVISKARSRRASASSLLDNPRYELLPLGGLDSQLPYLPAGATVTVTSSPSRGTMATVELAERLAVLGFRPVPHLAARQVRDEAELVEVLQRLDNSEIRDAFVVGGDGIGGGFKNGLELLRAMDAIGHRLEHIGVPSYPEGHHLIDDETLWADLYAKQDYATYTVTQMCFDADAIAQFVYRMRGKGISLPVVAGIPGIADPARLLRVSMRIGIGDSIKFLRGNFAAVRKLLRLGGYRPNSLVRKLSARTRSGECELSGVHIYTFNHVNATVRWVQQLRSRGIA